MDPLLDDEELPFSQAARFHSSEDVMNEPPFMLEGTLPPSGGYGEGSSRSKVFNDPVHKHIRVSGLAVDIIDTPQFQRLRDLKQLGTSYMVFPGASHNRFEHSIGVGYLAEDTATRFYRNQRDELDMELADLKVASIAGLCHDLGHGPFSHVFDNEFLPVCLNKSSDEVEQIWTHEEMSTRLLDLIIDENHIDGIDEVDLKRIKNIITSSLGTNGYGGHNRKSFLSEIVANGRNGVDVDKFDYLVRDSKMCGVSIGWDADRLRSFMKVIDGEICFKASEYHNVFDMFGTRASLYRRIYTHKKAKAIEYMLVDALIAANPHLKIAEKINSPEDFTSLDDTIIRRIEYSTDYELRDARAIIQRLRKRDIYKYVNEFTVPSDQLQHWKPVTALDITTHQKGTSLRPEDIVVQNLKIDYAKGNKNPVDYVSFFQEYDSTTKFHIAEEKVSSMLPRVFLERKVRVFSKHSQDSMRKQVAEAFEEFQRRTLGTSAQVHATPQKPCRKRLRLGGEPALRSLFTKVDALD